MLLLSSLTWRCRRSAVTAYPSFSRLLLTGGGWLYGSAGGHQPIAANEAKTSSRLMMSGMDNKSFVAPARRATIATYYYYSTTRTPPGSDSTTGGDHTSSGKDDEDEPPCPICDKFGKGPCGELFWAWWRCTELAEQQDGDHVKSCATQFERFQVCLEQNDDYYSNNSNHPEDQEKDD